MRDTAFASYFAGYTVRMLYNQQGYMLGRFRSGDPDENGLE